MIYKILLLLTLLSSNYLIGDLMKPTSLSKDLYLSTILDGNYLDSVSIQIISLILTMVLE